MRALALARRWGSSHTHQMHEGAKKKEKKKKRKKRKENFSARTQTVLEGNGAKPLQNAAMPWELNRNQAVLDGSGTKPQPSSICTIDITGAQEEWR